MDALAGDSRWEVVLDMGTERRATVLDALCAEATLREAGVDAVFFPWHPFADVLTPVGALRPLKLLVPPANASDARALISDIIAGSGERRDVLVPVADAWVLPYYVSVVVRHLLGRARERGGVWHALLIGLRLYVVVDFAFLGVMVIAQTR